MALCIEGIELPSVDERDALPTPALIDLESKIDAKLQEMRDDSGTTNLLLLGALAGIRDELARREQQI